MDDDTWTQLIVLVGVLVGVILLLAGLGSAARRSAIRRLFDGPVTKGVVCIVGEGARARVLYLVATVRGRDSVRIGRAFGKTGDTFVWCSQSPLDPGREIIWDAALRTLAGIEWNGTLDATRVRALESRLSDAGLALVEVHVARDVPYDDAARARQAWWVRGVKYNDPGTNATYHCDGLEWWLDATSGEGLWSLNASGEQWTSTRAAQSPGFRLDVGPAGEHGRGRGTLLVSLEQLGAEPPRSR